jgi:hypothetical protein
MDTPGLTLEMAEQQEDEAEASSRGSPAASLVPPVAAGPDMVLAADKDAYYGKLMRGQLVVSPVFVSWLVALWSSIHSSIHSSIQPSSHPSPWPRPCDM